MKAAALATRDAPTGGLVLNIEKALELVRDSKDLRELKDIRDQAQLLNGLARSREASRALQNDAAEVKLRAERRMGELLQEQARTGERATRAGNLRRGSPKGQPEPSGDAGAPARPPTLEELGIKPMLAKRAQQVARVPVEKLETFIRTQREHEAGEITTAGLLKVAASRNPHAASNVNDGDPEKNERFTPRALVEELHKELNFTRDFAGHPKAPATEIIGRKRIWTRDDDCFTKDWAGERGLGNWPFDDLVKFVPFAFIKVFTGEAELAAQPMPATRTDQPFWQEFIEPFRPDRGGQGAEVRFISGDERDREGRTRYGDPQDPEGADAGSAGFASAVVIFRGPFVRSPRVVPRLSIDERIAGLRFADDNGMAHPWRQALMLARGERGALLEAADAAAQARDGEKKRTDDTRLTMERFCGEATDLGFRARSPRPTLVTARCQEKGCKEEFRFPVAEGLLSLKRLQQVRRHAQEHREPSKAGKGRRR